MAGGPDATVLLGPASIDRYLAPDGSVERLLPGGGALNMAYHWAHAGFAARFVTRVGDDAPEVFLPFVARHGIAVVDDHLVAPGASASIDITVQEDRQPWMDNFVEGVWTGFSLTASERALVAGADRLHAVLVDAVVDAVHTLGDAGDLADVEVSADFLSFRHYDLERFRRTMRHVDIGFVGWPGDRDDPLVAGMREVAVDLRRLLVVTMGSRGVLVVDGRVGRADETWWPVEAVDVIGTTVGCGDAFIAAFLASWWTAGTEGADADRLSAALVAGAAAGAAATAWPLPLPDTAYVGAA